MKRSGAFLVALACGALAALPACNNDKPADAKQSSGDAGAARPPGVDKNLAEAVAAVAQTGEQAGPPPNGVFATPAAADKEMKAGDPPKLTLGGKGSGPTVTFGGSAAKSGKTLNARTEVSVRTGPQAAMPTLDLSFVVEPEKSTAAEGAAPTLPIVNAKVSVSKLSKEQPAPLPPEVAGQAAKMKGSKIRYELAPGGPAHITAIEPAKDSEESLSLVLRAAGDAISLAYLPYPQDALGVGAFWLVTTREAFSGLDVVAYRMIKIEKIEGDLVSLSVNTKRYAAGGQLNLPGLPPHQMAEFAGNTAGEVKVLPADPSKVQGVLTDTIGANITVPNAPQGRDHLGLQLQMRTQLVIQPK